MHATLSERGFATVAALFEHHSGIALAPAKRQLVAGRLAKLASRRGAASLDAYVDLLAQGIDSDELTRTIDALTTNETYFFREQKHFDFLTDWTRRWLREGGRSGGAPRLWSAASSSGEEAYSIAMVLAAELGLSTPWEVVGTDLSTAMVEAARRGLYPEERTTHLPADFRKRFALKGTGPYAGQMLVARELRSHVRFLHGNLMQSLPLAEMGGPFDIVFLRNVLIYFEPDAKRQIVERVAQQLRPGGYLFCGHAESLNGIAGVLTNVQPAIFRKPPGGGR